MNFYNIKLQFLAGTDIRNAAMDAIDMANYFRCEVCFNFNGVVIEIGYYKSPESLERNKTPTIEEIVKFYEEEIHKQAKRHKEILKNIYKTI